MCRIVGFFDLGYRGEYPKEEVIVSMRDVLSHGGPDDAGIYLDRDLPLAFGPRRLSILDLSPLGHQPMEFEDLVITYNGGVYNFKEIRKELEREGYSFVSNSDTEMMLKSFYRSGLSAVDSFRGMFVLALWDKKQKELILFKDIKGGPKNDG